MHKRIILHLAMLVSAVAVFTATAVAKFITEPPALGQVPLPSGEARPLP